MKHSYNLSVRQCELLGVEKQLSAQSADKAAIDGGIAHVITSRNGIQILSNC